MASRPIFCNPICDLSSAKNHKTTQLKSSQEFPSLRLVASFINFARSANRELNSKIGVASAEAKAPKTMPTIL